MSGLRCLWSFVLYPHVIDCIHLSQTLDLGVGTQSRLDDVNSPKMESFFTAPEGTPCLDVAAVIPEPIHGSYVRTFEQTRLC